MRSPELPAILGRDCVPWLLGVECSAKIDCWCFVTWYHAILGGILARLSAAQSASADSRLSTHLCHALSLVLSPTVCAAKIAVVSRHAVFAHDALPAALPIADSRHISLFQNQMFFERRNEPRRTAQTQRLAGAPERRFLERASLAALTSGAPLRRIGLRLLCR